MANFRGIIVSTGFAIVATDFLRVGRRSGLDLGRETKFPHEQ